MKISGSGASYSLAQVEHLPGDDVEEGQPAAHAQQRLGAVHAHRRAEAAVELDHGGLRDRRGGVLVGDLDVGQRAPCRAARWPTPGSCRSRRARGAGSSGRTSRSPTSSTPASTILSRALFKPSATHALDRRLAGVAAPQSPRDSATGPDAAKLALRDQLLTARNRLAAAPSWARRAPRSPATCCAAPEVRRAATVAAYVSIGAEPGTGAAARRAGRGGQAGDPAGAAARRRPRLGGLRGPRARWLPARRGLLEPAGRRLGVDAVATADVVLVPGLAVSPRRASGWAGAAGATTGRWPGCRSAPSPACCSTTARSAATSRSSRTTGAVAGGGDARAGSLAFAGRPG